MAIPPIKPITASLLSILHFLFIEIFTILFFVPMGYLKELINFLHSQKIISSQSILENKEIQIQVIRKRND